MFTPIDSLPAGILGVEARGRVSSDDRHAVLAPQIETALRKGRVKLLYVAGADFAGYDEGAPFDDAVFGSRHFNAFERIAFVSDDGRHARAVEALDGLMPVRLRRFDRREIDAAKAWLTE